MLKQRRLMIDPPICYRCRQDLEGDEVIDVAGWLIDPGGGLTYQGRRIKDMTPGMACILHAIARGRGRRITVSDIGQHCCSDAEGNAIVSSVSRMRRMFAMQNIPDPIGSQPPAPGYWWQPD